MAKILIVDDAEVLRMELKGILSGAGYTVVEGATGVEGLTTAKANPDIDLIISDLNMPEMDGITMCKKIPEIPGLKTVPMIMLTTESTPDLKQLAKEGGVKLWILKPFVAEKLLQAVAKVMEMFPKTA